MEYNLLQNNYSNNPSASAATTSLSSASSQSPYSLPPPSQQQHPSHHQQHHQQGTGAAGASSSAMSSSSSTAAVGPSTVYSYPPREQPPHRQQQQQQPPSASNPSAATNAAGASASVPLSTSNSASALPQRANAGDPYLDVFVSSHQAGRRRTSGDSETSEMTSFTASTKGGGGSGGGTGAGGGGGNASGAGSKGHLHPSSSTSAAEKRLNGWDAAHKSGASSATSAVTSTAAGGGAGSSNNSASLDRLIVHTTPRRSFVSENTPRLVYTTRFGGKTDFLLVRDETTIGRKDDNHIALPCPRISKHHAMVYKGEQGFYLRDRNSANGIKVNDRLINQSSPHLLREGDKIEIGTFFLDFHDGKAHKVPVPTLMNSRSPLSPASPMYSAGAGGGGDGSLGRVGSIGGSGYLGGGPSGGIGAGGGAGGSTNRLTRRPSHSLTEDEYRYTKLVTILPPDKKYEDSMIIQEEPSGGASDNRASIQFQKGYDVTDLNTLREDYEKLRLAYELSKVFSTNITEALSKSCELMFEILPIDRAVILLRDQDTNMLMTHYVRVREGKGYDNKEICVSSTILSRVFHSRKSLIISDAFEDPMLSRTASIKIGQMRSILCVPLISHEKVHGILHLDSQDRINAFSKKDLALVRTISTQTAMAIENHHLIKEIQNKAKLQENLSRFLPPHVVSKMTSEGVDGVRQPGRDVVGTILFADIRGFTQLSEKSTPTEVVSLLNDFFERLVNIVFKYNGIVDKYIGDALMTAFGTLVDEGEDPEFRAVCAALEFKEAIDEMNMERAKLRKEPIAVGIGLNTGELLTGFIGSSRRLEYTCIGDTVNTSSRICSMAAPNQVLISQRTLEALRGRFEVREVGGRMFKGKEKEVVVWEVLDVGGRDQREGGGGGTDAGGTSVVA
ncbi:hypothetical protein BDZ88DRAFT_403050 [Geranomyces variabilis]|nr:hypothetical protein BDZ88DRAFT_403050 [Geranomyces variabilis]KAJ3141761.1 hypothetical protein HDU90_006104 [Geranomyces variabilis]